MTTTLANLNGEVVSLAVHPDRRRAVALTDRGDAAAFGFPGADGVGARVRSALADLTAGEGPLDVAAGFAADLLVLRANWNRIGHGLTTATLALDPETGAAREMDRTEEFTGFVTRPVGVHDGRFVLVEGSEDYTTVVYAYALPALERHEVLRLYGDAEGIRPTLAGQDGLLYDPAARRVYLVTVDPDNWEGNRVLSVSLDADCRATGEPEKLVDVQWEPYSPCVGGACLNPFTGEAACLMYASEWEGVVPVTRGVPEDGGLLPVADLHVARPGAAPRRLDVLGLVGVNAELYDRGADAPGIADRFRFGFDFGGARAEVTPVVALGPDRYLVALFGGSLVALSADTGEQAHVHEFGRPITALAPGIDADSVLVGLATGEVVAARVPGASP